MPFLARFPAAAAALGPSAPNPALNLSAIGLGAGKGSGGKFVRPEEGEEQLTGGLRAPEGSWLRSV